MTEQIYYTYVTKALQVLDDKIDYITINYDPINCNVSGNLVSSGYFSTTGNSTIGDSSYDSLVVNATTTFNNDVTVGENSDSNLTVNSTTTFNNDVIFGQYNNGNLTVNYDAEFSANTLVDFRGNVIIGTYEYNSLTINSETNVNGTLITTGNTILGDNDYDLLTVNATTTFNNDVNANVITANSLTVLNDTIIGQDYNDSLIVNSATVFSSDSSAEFNGSFAVTENATFGMDTTNTITSNGTIYAPHLRIPYTNGNSLKFGTDDIIVYTEYSANSNIFTDHPKGVIVIVKNTSNVSISITLNVFSGTSIQASGSSWTYLKTSADGFVPIYPNTID